MKNVHGTLRVLLLKSLIISALIIHGCNEQDNSLAEDLKGNLRDAEWITDSREWPAEDKDMYGDLPAPRFRKQFAITKNVSSATLYITAAGYYLAYINGERIGRNVLDPAWTNYSKRIYYAEYDITGQIKQGINILGATTGNGFYNSLPMRLFGKYNLREEMPTGKPLLIARLLVEYEDGGKVEILTDKTWKHSYGPIRKNNVYSGEVFNASFDSDEWHLPDFDDSEWSESVTSDGPGGTLHKAFFPPVQITEHIKTLKVSKITPDTSIADLGVNFTGAYRIKLRGKKGDTVRMRFGERLYDNGRLNVMTTVAGQIKRKGMAGPGAPDIAWQCDEFIFGEEKEVWYSPSFTFHIFRYMEITGLDYVPSEEDIEGLAFNTNVRTAGKFNSSDELLNRVQEATRRTFLDNLISVQSDCPGREKFGYGGDLNATSESFIYNFDMRDFYRKTVYDWADAMRDTAFIDTAPFVGIIYCGISWESAFLITQDKLLTYYNDTALVREMYPLSLQWMEKVATLHPEGVVKSGLADHEALQKVPVELTGTTHYLDCARIMTKFASMMGDRENEDRFRQLTYRLKNMMIKMFWTESLPDSINKQTMFASLLYYDIIPVNDRPRAIDSLLKAVRKGPSGHFTTGIFGTKYILEAMAEAGLNDEVYNIVSSRKYPGWGHMIDRGATTIWETWKESDNVYSNCHPMFGTVTEWYYRWLGGIQPDPERPGFRGFFLKPLPPAGLNSAKCSYISPYGKIVSEWKKINNQQTEYYFEVPEGTEADVVIPVRDGQKVSVRMAEASGEKDIKIYSDTDSIRIRPGRYIISTVGQQHK